MKNLERALLKTLNCFWWAVLLAPIIAYVLSFAVGVFTPLAGSGDGKQLWEAWRAAVHGVAKSRTQLSG